MTLTHSGGAGVRLSGYAITEEISRDRRKVIYGGTRDHDGAPVLVMVSADRVGGDESLRREFELLRSLHLEGVPRPLDLLPAGDSLALVLEAAGRQRLGARIPPGGMDLSRFLPLAIRLSHLLHGLHRAKVVHKDIHPGNILVDPATGQPTLINFGIASRLTAESQGLRHPSGLEGTLAYLSPEQTGRMNRDIDYRTDFYSLGVTFYEMLTGRLPFESHDPLEMVHCHIARTPRSPDELRPEIPAPLSGIVLKLLAKEAEERYQSALGLQADLSLCWSEWEATGQITTTVPGRGGRGDVLLLPQRLYGRERPLAQLMAVFELVAGGASRLMLVSGYSGVGKSSLIRELYRPLVGRRGYFVEGKFDQIVRVPYGALLQAFRELIQQLLTEDEERLARWRVRLAESLGSGASVLAEVLPEVQLLIGSQPPPPSLGPAETQNRFRLVVQNFLGVVANRHHPLVIFLDDLQWADAATLNLVEPLLTGTDIDCLMLVGAYRDNEVDATHPLTRTIAGLRAAGVKPAELALAPLEPEDLVRLIGDTLHREPEDAEPLARLVARKTGGNPFFVGQFLTALRDAELIRFDYEREEWTFEMEAIGRAGMTDNVIDLMTRKIQRLSPRTQRVLTLAACIGNPFDPQTLAIVSEQPPQAAVADLEEAVAEGLVLPVAAASGAGYAFLHDRVQQSAYALIPDELKQIVHLTVGRLLRSAVGPDQADEKLFDIVHHLNLGRGLITDGAERLTLARLNLAAGQKAKASTAHEAALGYLEAGVELVSEAMWQSDYALAFSLHFEAAECRYLCGDFDEAERTFVLLMGRATTSLDRARVHRLRSLQYENMSRYADALTSAEEALTLFGVAFPDSPAEREAALDREIVAIQSLLGSRGIASLIELPTMTDPEIRMVMNILTDIWASAYILGAPVLARLISATMVRLSLEHGNVEESAYGYVTHAITVGPVRGDYDSAYEFGRLALRVNERFGDARRRAKIHQQFHAHVNLWCQPMHTCIPYAREACRSGLESGDFLYAAYGAGTEAWPALVATQDLEQFIRDYTPSTALIRKLKATGFADAMLIFLNWARALRGETAGPLSLSGHGIDEDEYLRRYHGNPFFTTFHAVARLQLCYLLGEYRTALDAARFARDVVYHLSGTIWPVLFDVWNGLTLAANYRDAPEAERPGWLREMETAHRSLAVLAESCPENYRCWALLLSAELERVQGRMAAAGERFREAVACAEETGSVQQQALANELAGRFWRDQGQTSLAIECLARARSANVRWGATAKVAELERRYGSLLTQPRAGIAPPVPEPSPEADIDLATVVKAARVLAGEIDLERLLERLMAIALENAGAERGGLVLEHDGAPRVHAQGSDDRVTVQVHDAPPLTAAGSLPVVIINYVRRTGESLVLSDARADDRYRHDPYVLRQQPRSVLATPLVHQGRLLGVVYLENNLATGVFTPERLALIQLLASQAAIAVQNAQLYEGLRREIADRTRIEGTLRTIAEDTAPLTGVEFFRALTRHAALILHTRHAFLAEICRDRPDHVSTLAFWVDDAFVENITYPLAGTPCEPVIAGEDCFHPEGVARLFPEDPALATIGAESYLGVPLRNSAGRILGHLAVIHDRAITFDDPTLAVLRIFATRAGAELERQRVEDALRAALHEVAQLRDRLQAENVVLLEEVKQQQGFEEIIGRSAALQRVLRQVEQVAPTGSTVLITGETGTGKELIARAIHGLSPRKDRPMVTVNCGAISAGLVESELFGHEKGAFTGAVTRKIGRFELASGGTIFLDEIGDLPLDLQVKLLRVLQEGELERVGGARAIEVDVRVIAATHKDLEADVEAGRFRADLYYRLNVFPLRMPALRERREDIPALARYFVMKYAARMGKRIETIPTRALETLAAYGWPGNVRELANILERSVIITNNSALELREWIAASPPAEPTVVAQPVTPELARQQILKALEESGWRVSGTHGAAQLLGLKPTTLEARMKKLGITRPGARSQAP